MLSPKFHWTYVVIFLCLYLFSENHDESQELVAKPDIKIEEKVDKPLEIQDIFNPQ